MSTLLASHLDDIVCENSTGTEFQIWCENLGKVILKQPKLPKVSLVVTHVQSEFSGAELVSKEISEIVSKFDSLNMNTAYLIFPGFDLSKIDISTWLVSPEISNYTAYLSSAGESPLVSEKSILVLGGYWANCHSGAIQNILFKARFDNIQKVNVIGSSTYARDKNFDSTPETLSDRIKRKGVGYVFQELVNSFDESTASDKLEISMHKILLFWNGKEILSYGYGPSIGHVYVWDTPDLFFKSGFNGFKKLGESSVAD
ncbi:MAG: hypothetical protein JNL11_09635 [Bdellovibrionaceae bacterium]|nr:hypothetical protein [Pseudobdellovibrionaceae bacterium]